MTKVTDDTTLILNNLFPPQKEQSLTLKALPLYSTALGSLTTLGISYYYAYLGWQPPIMGGIFVALLPYSGYFAFRMYEKVQASRIEKLKAETLAELKLQRATQEHELIVERERLAHEETQARLAIQRAELSVERQKLHLQGVIFERGVDTAIANGELRHDSPEAALRQQHERDQWRRILAVLYSEGNKDKTVRGTWVGGNGLTLGTLGRRRLDALKEAGLVYMRTNHPQWSTEVAGEDENAAMRALEAAGIFNIHERWGV